MGSKKKKRKKKKKIGCISIIIVLVALVVTFLNYKWYTQDKFWITYYGTPHEMEVVNVDSVETYKYYTQYHTLKFNDTTKGEVELIPYPGKGFAVGEKIKVNVLDTQATFPEKPNILYSIFLGILMLGSWYLCYAIVIHRFFNS